MPGIAERNYNYRDNNNTNYQNPSVGNGTMSFHASNGSFISSGNGNGFWSKHRDDISYNQLEKTRRTLTSEEINDACYVDVNANKNVFDSLKKNSKVHYDGNQFSYKVPKKSQSN
ncbi:Transcription initiation factor TFIIE [Forsythia ovata]|uniref:Transcription initiation factor TFIIE n=1 Tax=Forsythia ovata TaxID=205694 RepID=A0ABD1U9S1_9LAMI